MSPNVGSGRTLFVFRTPVSQSGQRGSDILPVPAASSAATRRSNSSMRRSIAFKPAHSGIFSRIFRMSDTEIIAASPLHHWERVPNGLCTLLQKPLQVQVLEHPKGRVVTVLSNGVEQAHLRLPA